MGVKLIIQHHLCLADRYPLDSFGQFVPVVGTSRFGLVIKGHGGQHRIQYSGRHRFAV